MQKSLATCFVLSSLVVQADVLTPFQRFFGVGGQYPEYSDESGGTTASVLDQAPYSPADSDLGVQEILVERDARAPIIFDFSTTILRTDNAPSGNPRTDEPSWVSASSFAVAWRPHVVEGWFADVGMGLDFLRYDRSNAVDFENYNFRLGTFKVLPDLDDTIVFVRYEYQRITSTSLNDGDYNAQRIRAGLQKVLWSAPRHQVTGNLSAAHEWSAHPTALERDELSLDVAYRYSITDSLYTVASARASRFNFDQFGRDDWTFSTALELIWQFDPNFRVNASLLFDKNDSNRFGNFNEYESWSAGVGLGAQWSF